MKALQLYILESKKLFRGTINTKSKISINNEKFINDVKQFQTKPNDKGLAALTIICKRHIINFKLDGITTFNRRSGKHSYFLFEDMSYSDAYNEAIKFAKDIESVRAYIDTNKYINVEENENVSQLMHKYKRMDIVAASCVDSNTAITIKPDTMDDIDDFITDFVDTFNKALKNTH